MQFPFAERMQGVTGSAIREIFKLAGQQDIISFAGGLPSPASLPAEELADVSADVLRKDGSRVLQYGATEGWASLRESVCEVVKDRGIADAQLENVTILTGSSQGIELATKLFINPGDVVLCEAPTFLGALQTFYSYEANVIGINMQDDGMDMDMLEQKIIECKPRLIYTIPTFQNPAGVTMSLAKRQRMAKLAEKYNVLVVEDDPYRDLRYAGEALPCIKSFDKAGMVLHLMSFSKTISPGLRVGAAIGNKDILRKLTVAKQGMDTHTSNLSQAVVDAYIRSGRYMQHIQEVVPAYRVQLSTMLSALESYPGGTRYTRPEGGLFVWLTLPEGIDAEPLLQQAIERKVAFIPGTHFYPGGGHENTLRLNFSASSPEQITEGMERLKQLIFEV